MDRAHVTAFLDVNRKYLFPQKKYSEETVALWLLEAPENFPMDPKKLRLRDPGSHLALSCVLGLFGIDRLFYKPFWLAFIKLLTWGGFYLWWIVDAITALRRCRVFNCRRLLAAVNAACIAPPAVQPARPVQTIPPAAQPARPAAQPISASPAAQSVRPAAQTVPQTYQPAARTPAVTPAAPAAAQTVRPATGKDTVFLSYSHRDNGKLLPLFQELERSGLSIWYDEGIRAGAEWEEEIIDHLSSSDSFLFFVTENSLNSQNCRDELFQARKLNKRFINILVEDVDLTRPEFRWFDFRYSRYQQIPAYALPTAEVIAKIHAGLKL